jgi:hypothetical protein
MIGRDGWAGLFVLALCAGLYWATLDLRGNPLVPIGPAFYPRIVIGVAALFSILVVLEDVLRRRKGGGRVAAAGVRARTNYPLVLLGFASFGLYTLAMPGLGFRIATVLYVAAFGALLLPARGAKDWAKVILLALLTAFITHYVFERHLSVLLPRGRWTDF